MMSCRNRRLKKDRTWCECFLTKHAYDFRPVSSTTCGKSHSAVHFLVGSSDNWSIIYFLNWKFSINALRDVAIPTQSRTSAYFFLYCPPLVTQSDSLTSSTSSKEQYQSLALFIFPRVFFGIVNVNRRQHSLKKGASYSCLHARIDMPPATTISELMNFPCPARNINHTLPISAHTHTSSAKFLRIHRRS